MTRGVKREGWTATLHRKRTYRRISGTEEYRLEFIYHEGSQYIDVRFHGHIPHDAINVFDYDKGESTITSKREVKAHVEDYMADMGADALRLQWENRPRG